MIDKRCRRVRWGIVKDNAYFGMWAVFPVSDPSESSSRRFWFFEKEDADQFIKLLAKSCHNMETA